MTDNLSPQARARTMAAVRSRDTRPEIMVRSHLHRAGFRFRLCEGGLPGSPDLVFPKFRAVIFINGCFWHGHDCPRFSLPRSRVEFWAEKINTNKQRDLRNYEALQQAGWRVSVVWECALRGKERLGIDAVTAACGGWLKGSDRFLVITGDSRIATNDVLVGKSQANG
ncbi:DNA mismatch endonuclease Vsr [Rhizobium leguminosarum bv. viciae]|uniref:DNA mismatch endonuclease Vsr n=1 Tax=Rhizobium leguminosarum TaxID=384 RepID=UPI001441CE69|nr:DNA mismatch endonuclease Vsr [Rhizobium leguminosarum bv. viciae]